MPSRIVHPLSSAIEHRAAPLIEPFGCVLHALERVPDWRDEEIVVFGAGSIGLMAVILGRAEGAAGVRLVEPNPTRRAAALRLGAVEAVATSAELDGQVFDIALDASEHPAAIAQAIDALGPRGRLIQMGVASPTAAIDLSPYEVFARELSIIGSNSLAEKYAEAAERMVDLQGRAGQHGHRHLSAAGLHAGAGRHPEPRPHQDPGRRLSDRHPAHGAEVRQSSGVTGPARSTRTNAS